MLRWIADRILGEANRATAEASPDGVVYNIARFGRDLQRGKTGIGTDVAELVSLAGQVSGIVGMRIAQSCAKHELCVFSSKSDARGGFGARSVGRSSARYLTGNGRGGPSERAMEYAADAGEIVELPKHPIKRMLDNPAHPSIITAAGLRQWVYLCMQIPARAELQVWKTPEGVDVMVPLMPQHVWYELDETVAGGVSAYFHGKTLREAKKNRIPADEVVAVKHTTAFDHLIPRGPMHNVMQEAALMFAHTTAEGARWENGAEPGVVFKVPTGTTADDKQKIADKIKQHFGGPKNKGKPLVTGDINVERFGFSPRDMEYEGGIRIIERRILAAFGYPETFYMLSDSNRASSTTARIQFAETTVEPLINTLCDQLTACLVPMFGMDAGDVWIGVRDEVIPQDVDTRQANARQDVVARTITRAEYREMFYPELEDPPDIENAKLLDPPPTAADPQAGGIGGLTGLFAPRSIIPQHCQDPHDHSACSHHAERSDLGPLDPDRRALVDASRQWRNGMSDWYKFALTDGTDSDGYLTSEARERLDAITRESAERVYELGGRLGLDAIGFDSDVFRVPPKILDDYTATLTAEISLSYEDTVVDLIRKGSKEGLSTAEITQNLRERAPDMADYAAERIARSETARAAEGGALEGWKESGVQQKEWLLAGGACPICTTFYGILKQQKRVIIPINELYAKAGAAWNYTDEGGRARRWVQRFEMQGARTHPNNRSQITAVMSDRSADKRCRDLMIRTAYALEQA